MKNKEPVAVAARVFHKHKKLRDILESQFENIKYNETGRTLNHNETIDLIKGCTKAIVSLEQFNSHVIDSLPELRVVSKYGVGLDNIDLAALKKSNILLGWEGGVNRRSVSELTLGFALSCIRNSYTSNHQVRSGTWRKTPGNLLSGKTIGIIGCGFIGKDLVSLLQPFGCKIQAHDIKDYPDFFDKYNIKNIGLEPLLRSSDIVTLHVPLTDKTRNMINNESIKTMKKGAILINTARGNLVDEEALKANLKSGYISSAAFDVFSEEPVKDMELVNLQNFIATPHIGGSAEEAIFEMGKAAINGLSNAQDIETYF